MGRWCEVKCSCPDREPITGSLDSDYISYRRHFKSNARSKEEWEQNIRNMYKCGHREGMYFQTWPGDLFTISQALDAAFKASPKHFEVFRRIYNWRNYDDEHLTLTAADAGLWQLEIAQLQSYLSGEEHMGFLENETFEKELQAHEFLYGDIHETLADGLKFCEASIKTGNPIEFLW